MQNHTYSRLSANSDIGHSLSHGQDTGLLLDIAKLADRVTGAEQSSIFVLNKSGTLEIIAGTSIKGETPVKSIPQGTGIAVRVVLSGRPVTTAHISSHPDYNPDVDVFLSGTPNSIICVPIRNRHGVNIGCIESLKNSGGEFSSRDEAIIDILASHASTALENAELNLKIEDINRSLEQKVQERTTDLVKAYEKLAIINKELEKLSITDVLTKIFNRRYFMERIKQEVKRVNRYQAPLSVLMIDIDHFKSINDRFGHQVGDVVLRNVALQINKRLRDTDILARYGGEEFILMATSTPKDGALILAERMCNVIASSKFKCRVNHEALNLTVSIGISSWEPEIQENYEELIRKADAALYDAKGSGRNCCRSS